jgi:CheY-like chemotaxis protein
MKILVVEDDYLQSEWLVPMLQRAFPRARIEPVSTEKEFRDKLPEIVMNPPTVVVMDVMLRWSDPEPTMEPPPREVQEGGFYRAGLRCQQLLAAQESTRSVPILLYTVLDREDLNREFDHLPDNVHYVRKSDNPSPLLKLVRQSMRRKPS